MSTSTVSTVPAWKKEFNDRIKAFSLAIGLAEEKVREKLSEYGADGESSYSLDMIDSEEVLPISELFSLFVDSSLVPKGRLRLGIATLRGKTHPNEATTTNGDAIQDLAGAVKNMITANRPKSDWSDEELLKAYNQDATEVAEILRKRTHGRPCIVFHRDGAVNTEVSLKLIKTAKRQPTATQFIWKKKPVRVYRAGEFLFQASDESPLFPKVALVNDYCPQSNTSWNNVDQKTRILVRIYVHDIESTKLSKMQMKQICSDAHSGKFEELYPEALLRYEELEYQDKLPKLKILPNDIVFHGQEKYDNAF